MIADTTKWTGKFPRTSSGYHALRCPVIGCTGERIETQCMNVTDEYDRNLKLCHTCGYSWRQVST